jgi:hypothetical protein
MTDTPKVETVGVAYITRQTGQRPQAINNMMRGRVGLLANARKVSITLDDGASVERWRIPKDVADRYVKRYLARKAADGS